MLGHCPLILATEGMSLIHVALIFHVDSEFENHFDVSQNGPENKGNYHFFALLIFGFFYTNNSQT